MSRIKYATKKEHLIREDIAFKINMLIAEEAYKYCIDKKMLIKDFMERAICKYLNISKEDMDIKEKEYAEEVAKDFGVWDDLYKDLEKLRKEYKAMWDVKKAEEKKIREKYQKLAEEEIRKFRKDFKGE